MTSTGALSSPGSVPSGRHQASLTFERLNGKAALTGVLTDSAISRSLPLFAMADRCLMVREKEFQQTGSTHYLSL